MQLKRAAILFSFIILAFCDAQSQKLAVSQLTCEYKTDPIGIETLHPRFSWIIHSKGRDIKQTAYQIIVSESKELSKKKKGNIWDSGKQFSNQSIHVPYKGQALQPATKYYWRVRIWDNKGNVSGWSGPASWQMGLLTARDWQNASWIAYDELPKSTQIIPAAHLGGKREWGKLEDTLPLLRKEFTVKKPVNVKKGWNEVLLKLPMGKFDPNLDWQVPPKWMFTMVPVQKGPGINWKASEVRFDVN